MEVEAIGGAICGESRTFSSEMQDIEFSKLRAGIGVSAPPAVRHDQVKSHSRGLFVVVAWILVQAVG